MDIDFVITWVDMNAPGWREEFAKYRAKEKNEKNSVSQARFRDNGLLRYWFRGVEKFSPWVRRVHFVTCGQKPIWLDEKNPKLHLVNHCEIIPEQFLPTFNSTVIERYIHKIPSLAEHFVYFNDDFYIINHVEQERFFRDGLPCDIAAFSYNPSWSQWYKRIKNNSLLINRHFDKREVMKIHHDKWFNKCYGGRAVWNYLLYFYGQFIPLRTPHNAQPYLKTTFDEVWNAVGKDLTETSANRFRAQTDLTPELFRTWQICRGAFNPYNTYRDTKMFPLMISPGQAVKAVRSQSHKLVCLNDNIHIRHYDAVMEHLWMAFEEILPEKSSFEI